MGSPLPALGVVAAAASSLRWTLYRVLGGPEVATPVRGYKRGSPLNPPPPGIPTDLPCRLTHSEKLGVWLRQKHSVAYV